jgi:hypothetical protein
MFDCKVYIAFHRKGKIISNDECYTALHVGKSISNLDLEIQHDATGDHISDKNEIYSELTGWYWIWKNQKHDYIGTSHYRRYFTAASPTFSWSVGKLLLYFIGLFKKRYGIWYVKNKPKWQQKILTKNEIQRFMNEFDVILPQKKRFAYPVSVQYQRRHNKADIDLTREIISKLHPDYLNTFDMVFQGKEMFAFNMFVMPWQLFESYMAWLFSILFELEKRSLIDMTDKYQKRVCAFMAERLQTVWIEKNNLKVKELPVLYFKNLKTEHL